jgi:hypothetical protein
MTPENQRPIMSHDVVKSGNQVSIKGYLNLEEAMRALLKGVGWSSAAGLGLAVLLSVLESIHVIYTGPLAPTVVTAAAVIAGYIRTKQLAKRLVDEGEDIDVSH